MTMSRLLLGLLLLAAGGSGLAPVGLHEAAPRRLPRHAPARHSSQGGGEPLRLRGGAKGDWALKMARSGALNVGDYRFDQGTAGSYLTVEDEGRSVRNKAYGAGCARTDVPMCTGMKPSVHYIEMELFGGGCPMPEFTGVNTSDGKWVPYGHDGCHGVAVGIIAHGDTKEQHFDETTWPDDAFQWIRTGQLKWSWSEEGLETAFCSLDETDEDESLRLGHRDRVGILLDLENMKLGFLRNGTHIKKFDRDISVCMPQEGVHFVVGGVRPNTRWVMVPQDQAMASLKNVDWDDWVAPPEPEFLPDATPMDFMRRFLPDEEFEHYREFMELEAKDNPELAQELKSSFGSRPPATSGMAKLMTSAFRD